MKKLKAVKIDNQPTKQSYKDMTHTASRCSLFIVVSSCFLSAAMPKTSAVDKHSPREGTCCGVVEEATYRAREKRAGRVKKQPWIVLKLMIAFTLGIMAYTAYVYIGRFCVNMIRRLNSMSGSRGTGSECDRCA